MQEQEKCSEETSTTIRQEFI